MKTKLEKAKNPFAWQRWRIEITIKQQGYYEVWSRATDNTGKMQPMIVANWNPKGYLNNAMPRISINIEV